MPPNSEKPSWKRFQKLRSPHKAILRGAKKIEKSTTRHARRFVSSRLNRLSRVKRHVLGWGVLVVVLAGVSVAQWVGFREGYMTMAANQGGTYSEGLLGPLETLNPVFARSNAEKSAARLMFAGLYTYDESGKLKGDLAESTTVDDEGTQYTVKLLPGLTWSDGAPLTAKDVVFTVNLLRNPESRTEISGWQSIGVEQVDARTVLFTLPGRYAPFAHALNFPVLPSHVLGEVRPSELREQTFSQSPVTSGPFAFRLMQNMTASGDKKVVHLVANPRYHRGQPRLERFQLYAYPTRDDIVTALSTSEISATPELTYAELPEGVRAMYSNRAYSTNDGVYALFNMQSGILSNRSVRQALALSVDSEHIRSQLSRAAGPLHGPILDSHISTEVPRMARPDVEQAKQLLEDDGWQVAGETRQKDGEPLELRMVALRGSDFSQVADELAKVWREELDIQVEVQVIDPLDPSQSVIQTVLQPRNFDVLVYRLVLGGDPDVYAYWHSTQASSEGLNFSNYSNAVVDDALSGGRARSGDRYRSDRYLSFVRRWQTDVPAVPLYQTKFDYIQSKSVGSMNDAAKLVAPEDRYASVIYWSASRASVYKTP